MKAGYQLVNGSCTICNPQAQQLIYLTSSMFTHQHVYYDCLHISIHTEYSLLTKAINTITPSFWNSLSYSSRSTELLNTFKSILIT